MQTADNKDSKNRSNQPAQAQWRGVASYWDQDGLQVDAPPELQCSGLVLVCEHASNRFVAPWGTLGLVDEAASSHIAWDHVTHTLKLHATPYDLSHAMLEVRNDLLATPKAAADLTEQLTVILTAAVQAPGIAPCLAS